MEATLKKIDKPQTSGRPVMNLRNFVLQGKKKDFKSRVQTFARYLDYLKQQREQTYGRLVLSPAGMQVTIWDGWMNRERQMLMFASNNYLGLANHPHVKKKVNEAMEKFGIGLGGPPLLNGYTLPMQQLEERLARLKHQESALIFPTGYSANLGLITALVRNNDHILMDELSHASLYDAIRMVQVPSTTFRHNNIDDLEEKLARLTVETEGNVFTGVEGVYSMDGDLAPLDKMVPIFKKYGAISMLDDAHGTGILGKTGSGTAEYFGVEREIDLSIGTFSKAFSMTGGFVAGPKDVVDFLRFFARSYMFSAALPPVTLAAVHAGIDIIENEPWARHQLLKITRYAARKLKPFGLVSKPGAAIVALQLPQWMDIRKANYHIHEQGIFLNAIEYPAVPKTQQRFRISFMSGHTKADVDRLVEVIWETWQNPSVHIDK